MTEVTASAAFIALPLWLCACGARNRLRDLVCRHCGDPNPMREEDDCDA